MSDEKERPAVTRISDEEKRRQDATVNGDEASLAASRGEGPTTGKQWRVQFDWQDEAGPSQRSMMGKSRCTVGKGSQLRQPSRTPHLPKSDLATRSMELVLDVTLDITPTESVVDWMSASAHPVVSPNVTLPVSGNGASVGDSGREGGSGGSGASDEDYDVAAIPPAAASRISLQLLTLMVLGAASFTSNVNFAIVAPFYPNTAAVKGASPWEIGFIIAIYQVGAVVVSPVLGNYMNHFGAKLLLVLGLFLMGGTTMMFGAVAYAPNGVSFVGTCMVLRLFQGIASGAVSTSVFAIIIDQFPLSTPSMLGLIEAFVGLAFIFGPILGAGLYAVAGFFLPFEVIGVTNLAISLVCHQFLSDTVTQTVAGSQQSVKNPIWKGLLTGVLPWLCAVCIMSMAATISFIDMGIARHMDKFELNVLSKGLMMSALSISYAVAAPLLGKFVAKTGYFHAVLVTGACGTGLGLLILGPVPFLEIPSSIWVLILTFVWLGATLAALLIPAAVLIVSISKRVDNDGSPEALGIASGFVNFFIALGALLGPAVGGFFIQDLGFAWSTGFLGIFHMILCLSLLMNAAWLIFNGDEIDLNVVRPPTQTPPISSSTEAADGEQQPIIQKQDQQPTVNYGARDQLATQPPTDPRLPWVPLRHAPETSTSDN